MDYGEAIEVLERSNEKFEFSIHWGVDKKQFLAQTARPVTIGGLSVHEVRVRMLGDVAIIHARTN
jgi:hypothetical protein